MSSIESDDILEGLLKEEQPFEFVELDEDRDFCHVDAETARTLELVKNNVDSANRKHSLFGILNDYTSTTAGSKLLQEAILRPISHIPTLEHRLDCIEFLVEHPDVLGIISSAIRRCGLHVDMNVIVSNFISAYNNRGQTRLGLERKLDALTSMESLVNDAQKIGRSLCDTPYPKLDMYKDVFEHPDLDVVLESIHSVLEDASSNRSRAKREKIFRVKNGVDALFDLARATYFAAIQDIEQYVRELNREDGLPWKLSYSETRGHYLTMNIKSLSQDFTLSPRYLQVNKLRGLISCTTRDLMQSNVRANVSYENSMKLGQDVLDTALAEIIPVLSTIENVIRVIAMLDLLTCFAKLVTQNSDRTFVRPKFSPMDTIIVGGRHLVLESVLRTNELTVTPNDTTFSMRNRNFMLITGPNMGGKSVYLKQVAIIQILAQIGCYVPAKSAHIKVMNRIVSRTGKSDDHHSNCSSFMWEMRGLASALNDQPDLPEKCTLYVFDEFGRGTSIDDGASLCFAVAEELALRRFCFTVFATHFEQVFSLPLLYKNITAYHFKFEENNDGSDEGSSKLSHQLHQGVALCDHYGIRLAEICGLPGDIIKMAKKDLNITC